MNQHRKKDSSLRNSSQPSQIKQKIGDQKHKIPKKHQRNISMTDVQAVPIVAISDLKNKVAGIDNQYISVAGIQPAH